MPSLSARKINTDHSSFPDVINNYALAIVHCKLLKKCVLYIYCVDKIDHTATISKGEVKLVHTECMMNRITYIAIG